MKVLFHAVDCEADRLDPYRKRAAEKYGVLYNEVTLDQRQAMKVEMYRELYSTPRVWPINEPLPK